MSINSGSLPGGHRPRSRTSNRSAPAPPLPSITPIESGADQELEPCAASASHFLYAQRNVILALHHDTLQAERAFDRHKEDILWIAVDNASDRGAGRLVVSYDVSSTAIVWDIATGDEVARFAAYEHIRTAAWMRNGNIVFGNSQGNVILFEPPTAEHLSAKTIYDPINSLAPSSDCRTFAIGYANGSILIANLQPQFTILHSLASARRPSPIAKMEWHGSSSKQKSEMLAVQTADGDLRIWSVPKQPSTDPPTVIRILNRSEHPLQGPCWFGWSKNGRIVQYRDGETTSWDVRTKRVTYERMPTVEGVTAIANYGATATLFTLCGRNHSVQQYDINPVNAPALVANVQHVPGSLPPSPPNSLEEAKKNVQRRDRANRMRSPQTAISQTGPSLPLVFDETSEEEGVGMISPLQKIAEEMDALEDERRDRVGPLSPQSSKGSTLSSRSSHSGHRSRHDRSRNQVSRSDRMYLSQASATSASDVTSFSNGSSYMMRSNPSGYRRHESVSTRSILSTSTSSKPSRLRNVQNISSPEAGDAPRALLPFVASRLSDVPFRAPSYDQQSKTPDDLRRQMLGVVFGWDDDIEALIRDELSRHPPTSTRSILLSRWLGDINIEMFTSNLAAPAITSSDWMLLALSAMGQASQKKVGEAFVQRLLEKNDVHPAAAILLGMGEPNEAVEVYVSRKYYMEAVLLTCLVTPQDWLRQCHLVRKWGEHAVGTGQAELAVRCFSCTSVESTEPWFSPRAQEAVYAAQKVQALGLSTMSPPLSPPVSNIGPSARLAAKNSALKLITNFAEKSSSLGGVLSNNTDERTPMNPPGITPIAESALESALSPVTAGPWLKPSGWSNRDPTSARSHVSRGRRSNRSGKQVTVVETPVTRTQPRDAVPTSAVATVRRDKFFDAAEAARKRSTSQGAAQGIGEPDKLYTLAPATYQPNKVEAKYESRSKNADHLPSPARGVFTVEQQNNRSRNGSRDRKPDGLQLQMIDTVLVSDASSTNSALSPVSRSSRPYDRDVPTSRQAVVAALTRKASSNVQSDGQQSPAMTTTTSSSAKSYKGRSVNDYISSLDSANHYAVKERKRTESRERRSRSRPRHQHREPSEAGTADSRGRGNVRYIKPAKRSPSSPVPMSPEDVSKYQTADSATTAESHDEENFYRMASPVDSHKARGRSRSAPRTGTSRTRAESRTLRPSSPERRYPPRSSSKPSSRANSRPAEGISRQRSPEPRSAVSARSHSQAKIRTKPPSPTSPMAMLTATSPKDPDRVGEHSMNIDSASDISRTRHRERSSSRRAKSRGTSARRDPSPDRRIPRERSTSRNAVQRQRSVRHVGKEETSSETSRHKHRERSSSRKAQDGSTRHRSASRHRATHGAIRGNGSDDSKNDAEDRREGRHVSRKELAAQELEARRQSLARRPSVPVIPHPGELRPSLHARAVTDLGNSPTTYANPYSNFPYPERPPMSRSHTADPHMMVRPPKTAGVSTVSTPIGLPATPRALRHPRYMQTDPHERDAVPALPEMPDDAAEMAGVGFSALQVQDGLPLHTALAYGKADTPRSASAPIEKMFPSMTPSLPSPQFFRFALPTSSSQDSGRRGHALEIVPPGQPYITTREAQLTTPATDGPLRESQVVVVVEDSYYPSAPQSEEDPPLLPELQHLSGPPPPPPPPTVFSAPPDGRMPAHIVHMSDESKGPGRRSLGDATPVAMTYVPPTQPLKEHRRGRHSISENIGSRIRSAAVRMRSTSRSRAKSPPVEPFNGPSPYESIPLPMPPPLNIPRTSTMSSNPPSAAPTPEDQYPSTSSNASTDMLSDYSSTRPGTLSTQVGYRHPKEIRANMPPESIQAGVNFF